MNADKDIEIVSREGIRFVVPGHYGGQEIDGQSSWPSFASAVTAARSTIRVISGIDPLHNTRAFVTLRMGAVYANGGGCDREVLRWEVFHDRVVMVPADQGGLSDDQKTRATSAKMPTLTASQPPKSQLPDRWNSKAGKRLPTNPRIEAFLDEIEQVCRKHGMTISHEDHHGSFEIDCFDGGTFDGHANIGEFNIAWLRAAFDSIEDSR